MPGLFVSCGSPRQAEHHDTTVKLLNTSCRVSAETAIVMNRQACCIAVSHRGVFRSTGGSVGDRSAVGCLGAFWFDGTDRSLGTPESLRARLESLRDSSMPVASGVLCYAYWDEDEKKLILESDTTCSYSLYYLLKADRLLVATELRSFIDAGLHDGDLDVEGIAEYLKLGYIASERTFFHGVKRLPMGCRLTWKDGRARIDQIWQYRLPRDRVLNDSMIEQLADVLLRNLARYTTEPGRYSLTLSGGLDSRMLAAAAKDVGLNFTALTVGPTRSLECRIARQIAEMLGLQAMQHEYDGDRVSEWLPSMVWLTEGRCPPAHIHYFDTMFSGAYPGGAQVHGMLGDAILGGSNYYPAEPRHETGESLQAGCQAIAIRAVNYWPNRCEASFSYELAEAMRRIPETTVGELLSRYSDIREGGGREAFRYWFRGSPLLGVGLSSQVTPWTEIVCPFSDPELIDLAGQVRGEDFFERNLQYRMVYRRWPEVSAVPRIVDGIKVSMSHYDACEYDRKARVRSLIKKAEYYLCRATGGRIEIYDRTGFHDFARWYRRDSRLREMFSDTIHSRATAERGLWRPGEIQKLMDGLHRGKSIWPAVASVVFIEMYLQQLFGGRNRPLPATNPSYVTL